MRISELIIRFIDWFYRKPVAAILPRQTFRYVVCGGANAVSYTHLDVYKRQILVSPV